MILGIKKRPKHTNEISIKDYHNKRNKVVIIRNARGIGDVLNCRMLFKNFKRMMPEVHLTFACFKEYEDIVKNHPFLDEVINVSDLNKENYIISYDISTCCIKYESMFSGAKNTKHRAEIWAEHCGVSLQDHDMQLPFIRPEKISEAHLAVKQLRGMALSKNNKDGPSVFLSPFAFDTLRSLTLDQLKGTVKALRNRGLFIYSSQKCPMNALKELDVPVLVGNTLSDWMGHLHAANYVVSVDTATFHYAGGINKPLTGIFTHVDGKLRGKFYDFILVQKHRDNGDWPCNGPCYNYMNCTHPKCSNPNSPIGLRPCVTELTVEEIAVGIDKMLRKWNI